MWFLIATRYRGLRVHLAWQRISRKRALLRSFKIGVNLGITLGEVRIRRGRYPQEPGCRNVSSKRTVYNSTREKGMCPVVEEVERGGIFFALAFYGYTAALLCRGGDRGRPPLLVTNSSGASRNPPEKLSQDVVSGRRRTIAVCQRYAIFGRPRTARLTAAW